MTQITLNIAGQWGFIPGAYETMDMNAAQPIELPGSVTERGYGELNERKELLFLTEKRTYTGKVVFVRDIEVTDLAGHLAYLYLERTRETRVWVNGTFAGKQDLLTSAHIYEISALLTEGKNQIVVEVDNTYDDMPKDAIFGSHMATEHTQTNWIGIVGRMEIQLVPKAAIEQVRVQPCAAQKTAAIFVKANLPENIKAAELQVMAGETCLGACCVEERGVKEIKLEVKLPEETPLWSEFNPQLTSVKVTLKADDMCHEKDVTFGLRDYGVSEDKKHVAVNGKNIFIRSEANCAVFPQTGYAPMDEASWEKLFRNYQALGVNYMRCHSWCPPEAAYAAADRMGIYVQPELCEWTFHTFEDDMEYDFYTREAMAIIDQYGNHPSLVAMTWGNELRSDNRARMSELIFKMKEYDPTRLYSEGSNTWYGVSGTNPDNDYVMAQGDSGRSWRGAFAGNKGHINENRPGAHENYSDNLDGVDMPIVSFEVGQFQVYPDYDEINKYNGPLEPRNLMAYQETLKENGMEGMDKAFHYASGRLSLLNYREEIEAVMRTPGMTGISLLGVQDFSGQGTALVGMLDALGDVKSFLDAAEFRKFFAPVTPLLVFDHNVCKSGETVPVEVKIHNFGPCDLETPVQLRMVDAADGTILYEQSFSGGAKQGMLNDIGEAEIKLPQVKEPMDLELQISIGEAENSYLLSVYPETVLSEEDKNCIVHTVDENTLARLQAGESLLILPERTPEAIPAGFPASYIADFWCWIMFKDGDPEGTLGLCPDPAHPLFAEFPTKGYTDPRWWSMLRGGRAMKITGAACDNLLPMIDNIQRNNRLSMAFEASVGAGRAVVCSLNLPEDAPEAQCFLKALIDYVRSDRKPAMQMDAEELKKLLPQARKAITVEEIASVKGYINDEQAKNILKNDDSIWGTDGGVNPEDCTVELMFDAPKNICMCRFDYTKMDPYATSQVDYVVPSRASVEVCTAGNWKPVDLIFMSPTSAGDENICYFEPVTAEGIRIRLIDEGTTVAISALNVFQFRPAAIRQVTIR